MITPIIRIPLAIKCPTADPCTRRITTKIRHPSQDTWSRHLLIPPRYSPIRSPCSEWSTATIPSYPKVSITINHPTADPCSEWSTTTTPSWHNPHHTCPASLLLSRPYCRSLLWTIDNNPYLWSSYPVEPLHIHSSPGENHHRWHISDLADYSRLEMHHQRVVCLSWEWTQMGCIIL